jgi:membrane protein implicated in regulation of membrane protease activity
MIARAYLLISLLIAALFGGLADLMLPLDWSLWIALAAFVLTFWLLSMGFAAGQGSRQEENENFTPAPYTYRTRGSGGHS